jgi:hypothetical protein
MMIWLTPEGEYLVQGTSHPLPDWAAAVRGPAGEPVRPARFYLVTRAGEVRRVFHEPGDCYVDETHVLSDVHAVFEDALVHYCVLDHLRFDMEIESRVELAGLRKAEPAEVPSGLRAAIEAYDERKRAEGERQLAENARRWTEYERCKLRDPSQLPPIDAPSFILEWDWDCPGDEWESKTHITHGGHVIFAETALYEGFERFIEVAGILRARYGAALRDLVPTARSKLFLYGDRMSASGKVSDARRRIFSTGENEDGDSGQSG